jgi:hypothetical protein
VKELRNMDIDDFPRAEDGHMFARGCNFCGWLSGAQGCCFGYSRAGIRCRNTRAEIGS